MLRDRARRRGLVPALLLAVVLFPAGCSLFEEEHVLTPGGAAYAGSGPARTNQHLFFGLTGFEAHGDDPVRFAEVELTERDQPLTLHRVWAVSDVAGMVGVGDAKLLKERRVKLEPLSHATFVPGERERWYVLAEVSANKPGTWRAKGIRVHWTAGELKGTQDFRYGVGIEARD